MCMYSLCEHVEVFRGGLFVYVGPVPERRGVRAKKQVEHEVKHAQQAKPVTSLELKSQQDVTRLPRRLIPYRQFQKL